MAFDYGERRIGVAIGQTVSRTATPIALVEAIGNKPNWPKIEQLVAEWSPDAFVIGFPATADGSETPFHRGLRRFATTIGQKFRKPIHYTDERLSSYMARDIAPRSKKNTKQRIDAHAAQVILETWLESLSSP